MLNTFLWVQHGCSRDQPCHVVTTSRGRWGMQGKASEAQGGLEEGQEHP